MLKTAFFQKIQRTAKLHILKAEKLTAEVISVIFTLKASHSENADALDSLVEPLINLKVNKGIRGY